MPRPQPLGNFQVLGFRRHGFEATRTPEPARLTLDGLAPSVNQVALPDELDFPDHSPNYVSQMPGTGGYGMQTPGGAGRDTGTTVIFVDTPNAGNSGTAIDASLSAALGWGVPAYHGTMEWAWRHSASPKTLIINTSGVATIQDSLPCQTGTPPRPGFVTVYGQFAPAPGFMLRGCNLAGNGASDLAVWHLRSAMGDDATGLPAGNRDCFSSGYGGGVTSRVVLINCEFQWSVDEICDFYRTHSEVSILQCAIIEPLHDSIINHPEDPVNEDHGFGPLIGGDTANPTQPFAITTFRNLWAHTTGRNPLTNATTFTHANNLHYNHGRPTGINADGNAVQLFSAGDSITSNILGNAFIRGPNNRGNLVAVSVSGSLPPGSACYLNGNSQFGWTPPASQAGFVTNAPAGFVASSLQLGIPGSWGGLNGVLDWAANPLSPTATEWADFVDLMERSVGAQPRWRRPSTSRLRTVFQQIRDRLAGVTQTNQFVNTVAEAGGWPTIAVAQVHPLNPGTHWHAPIPTGSDVFTPYTSGTFSDGKSRIGYTRLEAWAYEQHLYVMRLDQEAPNAPASLTASALSQTAIRLSWAAATDNGNSGLGGYRVYRATTSGGTYTQVGGDIAAGTTTFDDTSLSASTTRFYQVEAFDVAGNVSSRSNTASATTNSQPGSGQFTPTHFVTATATGSGNGTQASPFTLEQACALAQPGWRVQVAPGTYIGPNRGNRLGASFSITTQGTEANPIVFFAQNYAALNTTGRSILQNTATVSGQGCPVIAANGGHWWVGFYINEDQAFSTPDTGPVVCFNQWNKFSYMRINRGNNGSWPVGSSDNNHAAIRFEFNNCRNNTVSDCWIENYSRGGSQLGEQGIQIYGADVGAPLGQDVGALTFENNFFDNCRFAVTSKSIGGRLIEGGIIFRRNIINVGTSPYTVGGDIQAGGIDLIEMGNGYGRTQIYQNIQIGGAVLCKISQHAGAGAKDIDIVNNTCINLTRNQEFNGFFSAPGNSQLAVNSGWRCHNNVKTGTALARMFRYDTGDQALQSMSHNMSFGASPARWAEHPDVPSHSSLQTLAQWVAGSSWDDNSSEANPLYVSTTVGSADLGKLQAGSPARNFGVDVLNLLGGGTSATINAGAYITSGMTDQIGIRPLV